MSTTTGAIPSLVGDQAGLLVPPGEPVALRAALARLFDEPELRASLAAGARAARESAADVGGSPVRGSRARSRELAVA